jgi:glycerol-3-phosphate dehydrogenase
MPSGNPSTRPQDLSRESVLRRFDVPARFDVLIIGAGINGAATFRDLALQGVRCAIVDREDFGAGASSSSTRIAHGGLRYLENGEIGLVAESTRERNLLLHNAAHSASPLLSIIPSFSLFGGALGTIGKLIRKGRGSATRSRGLLLTRLGLVFYDWLGRKQRVLPKAALYWGDASRQLLPGLHPAVRGFVSYYDAKVSHPERIAFELVADGLAANPDCLALNHCEFDRHRAGEVFLRDRLSGHELIVMPKLVINACGAWIDLVNQRIGPTPPLIGGTKGSHVVIDNARLREVIAGRAFLFDDGSGRMCVAYTLDNMVLLGSTDARIDNPDEAVCDDQEVEYLLGAIRLIFPFVEVRRDQIKFRFSGVRPLSRSRSEDTFNISRGCSIARRDADPTTPFPVLSLVGGRWTTFRAFGQRATDRVLAELELSRRQSTENLPIGGGNQFPRDDEGRRRWAAQVANDTGLVVTTVEELLARYGTRARQVAAFCAAGSDAPLVDAPEYSEREIAYLVQYEMAATLEDIVFRRTTLAVWGRITFQMLCRLAAIAVQARGLNALQEDELLASIIQRLKRENGIDYLAELDRHRDAGPIDPERSDLQEEQA